MKHSSRKIPLLLLVTVSCIFFFSCEPIESKYKSRALGGLNTGETPFRDPQLTYTNYAPDGTEIQLERLASIDKLAGFWLGQSIANWTGLSTEMCRVEAPFLRDEDWGQDTPQSIWGFYPRHTTKIDFFVIEEPKVWGADDDTDIEYIYQHLLDQSNTSILSPARIREGWLKHIYSDEDAPISAIEFKRDNYLWVSNQEAYTLMLEKGFSPPETSSPEHNEMFNMIDAQLTTEIFGLFAPGRPDIALKMAHLPIRTTAREEAAMISEFYVIMHSLAAVVDTSLSMKDQVFWLADQARSSLPDTSIPAAMYDFVFEAYMMNTDKGDWESTRDAIFNRYQLNSNDGYVYEWPFDAGINFAAGMISLFYGEGDFKRTVQIGALAGWDSDNPTATWGGLLGYLEGMSNLKQIFDNAEISESYWIHRTRRNFPDHTPHKLGEDDFTKMGQRALGIIDRVVIEEMRGGVSFDNDRWLIPDATGKVAS